MLRRKHEIHIGHHPKRRRHWGRLLFILIGVALVVISGLVFYAYRSLGPMRQAEKDVRAAVRQQTRVTTVDTVTVDYRETTIYGAIGKTATGTETVVLLDKQCNVIHTYPRREGLSDQALRRLIMQRYHPKKVTQANLSYYQKQPVWEITYVDGKDQLNYVTLDFKTGAVIRQIDGI